MDVISENIANANTTRTSAGTPYRRKVTVFRALESDDFSDVLSKVSGDKQIGSGVEVMGIREDLSEFKREYNPGHPDADEEGYVLLPNVEIVSEMINLISASRAYEANTTALNSTKSMALRALDIGK
jgi:flagellar basal-body rod protein FlgC